MTRTTWIGLISIAYVFASLPAESPNRAYAAPSDPPLLSVDVTVLPGSRLLLTTPLDADVLHAPVAGSYHVPESDLMLIDPESGAPKQHWESAEDDPNAVAIVKYPDAVYENIEQKRRRWELYNRYLQDYGLPGVFSRTLNQPWNSESPAGTGAAELEAAKAKGAAELEAADALKVDDISEAADTSETAGEHRSAADLVKLRDALHSDAPLPDDILTLERTIASKSKMTYTLNDVQWRDVLEKAIVYNLRESLGLNSRLIEFGSGHTQVMAPNELTPVNVTLTVERTHEEDDVSATNLKNFLDYWNTVVDRNLYSDDDIYFLRRLTSQSASSAPEVDSKHLDWKTTSIKLVAECNEASASLKNWRAVTKWYPVSSDPKAMLKSNYPSLPDPIIADLSAAISFAKHKGEANAADGRPESASSAVQWIAEQTHASWSYKGSLIKVQEEPGVFSGTNNSARYMLLSQSSRGPIVLPEQIGGSVWRELQENAARVSSNFESDRDPFGPLVWQTFTTLSPTTEAAAQANASADDLYSAGQLVAISAEDLREKIREAAVAVRDYCRELKSQYDGDLFALHNGKFVVQEPAIVDNVYVADHEHLKARAPIAVVRSIYRYELEARFALSSEIEQFLLPGTPIRLKLSCQGPIDTTAAEKRAIVVKTNAATIVKWLAQVKRNYLSEVEFDARIDALVPEPNSTNSSSTRRMVNASFSFAVPENKRSLPTDALPGVGSLASSKEALLTTIGFPLTSKNTSAPSVQSLVFNAGPLVIGETCKATFTLPNQQERDTLQLRRSWDGVIPTK